MKYLIILLFTLVNTPLFASKNCLYNPDKQKARSAELQQLVQADQKDREHLFELPPEVG